MLRGGGINLQCALMHFLFRYGYGVPLLFSMPFYITNTQRISSRHIIINSGVGVTLVVNTPLTASASGLCP